MIKKIIINGMAINNLNPLKNSFNNKNNKFSARGFIGLKKVKIFESFDKNQGVLLDFISKNKVLSKYFPKLITFNKKFIVEEWVNGKTLKELNLNKKKKILLSDEVKKIINLMWATKYERKVFDYLKYIHKRVGKKNSVNLTKIPIRINHNDLSLDNIVLTTKGLKIIDNEFLGCNNGWVLNIKNSFIDEDFQYQNYLSEKKLNKLWKVRRDWSKVKLKDLKNNKSIFFRLIKNIL